ncbi:MAG: YegS/Rv2252/BmrU family lipid kinase, partial [Lachnospiraceae bacterium]|nr:YegS/Rv2252/BmrU family lipid kinase [Lachnospiraceae bacterium]
GHAGELAREISSGDPQAVIVPVGGDGSINEVLNGLTNLDTVTLGLIPAGSGNDFAAGMQISKDPEEAVRSLLDGNRSVLMDVGLLTYNDGTQRHFGISAGFGFDAAVCQEAFTSPLKAALNRFGLGKAVYSAIAVKQIAFCKPFDATLETDSGEIQTIRDIFFIAFMNQKFEGGGLMMTPDARPDDGLLDLLVCAGITRPTLVKALPSARHGGHVGVRGLHFIKARSVDIHASCPRAVHTDGEPLGMHDSLRVGFENQKLRVLI